MFLVIPKPAKINTQFVLGEVTWNVNSLADDHPTVDTDLLRQIAQQLRDGHVGDEDVVRALGQAFQDTCSFSSAMDELHSSSRRMVESFLEGAPAATFDRPLRRHTYGPVKSETVIYEDVGHKQVMKVPSLASCQNEVIQNEVIHTDTGIQRIKPTMICFPETVLGVQNLVKSVQGRIHSSTAVMENGDTLVHLHDGKDFNTIQVMGDKVKVGAAVPLNNLRHWALTNSLTVGAWFDTAATDVDGVAALDYVDVHGNVQSISDQLELQAASRSYAVLGITTHVTFQKSSTISPKPGRLCVLDAIPPFVPALVPECLAVHEVSTADFTRTVKGRDCVEWYWHSYSSDVLVDTAHAVQRPFTQSFVEMLAGVVASTDFMADIPPRWQSQLLAALLSTTSGCSRQRMRLRSLEAVLNLPTDDGRPANDPLTILSRAWWVVIEAVYTTPASALRIGVGMTYRKSSRSPPLLSCYQSDTGSVTLTLESLADRVTEDEWIAFCHGVKTKWEEFVPDVVYRTGDEVEVEVKGNAKDKTRTGELRRILESIGKRQSWKVDELRSTFSNSMVDDLLRPKKRFSFS